MIRRIAPSDASRLAAIEKKCFPSPRSKSVLKDILAEGAMGYVSVDAITRRGLGFCLAWPPVPAEAAPPYIIGLCTVPWERGRGYAKIMLSLTLTTLHREGHREVRLTCAPREALGAYTLYLKVGFVDEGPARLDPTTVGLFPATSDEERLMVKKWGKEGPLVF